jgi:hypothetical protein
LSFGSSKKGVKNENVETSEEKTRLLVKLKPFFTPLNVVIIILTTIGFLALLQVGIVMLTDITFWGKDINLIFFGSRAGENISLGIGVKIIHYYLVGIILIFSAIVLLFLKRWKIKKI